MAFPPIFDSNDFYIHTLFPSTSMKIYPAAAAKFKWRQKPPFYWSNSIRYAAL